jgi:hypothetical protein
VTAPVARRTTGVLAAFLANLTVVPLGTVIVVKWKMPAVGNGTV